MAELEDARIAAREAGDRHRVAQAELLQRQAEVSRLEKEHLAATAAYTRLLEAEVARGGVRKETPRADLSQWLDPGTDFEDLVVQAGSRASVQRLEAGRMLERMGPKAVEPLVAMVRRENRLRWARLRTVAAIAVGAAAAALGEIALGLAGTAGAAAANLLLLAIVIGSTIAMRATLRHRRAAEALARIKDERVAGTLAQMLELGDWSVYGSVRDALRSLLPRLHARDAEHFTAEQLDCLYRVLSGSDVTLIIAVLRGLEQVGDERAAPVVARLAEGKTPASRDIRVQEAAAACLPVLLDRTLDARPGRSLLRPATAPAGGEALLRPASGVGDADPDLLLRAARPAEGGS
ncbi:MAG: hypothetical protein IT208_07075 [Chthonomonadales bacterium]|nr:hypothetical protein [Chthonomonadales bacterium]